MIELKHDLILLYGAGSGFGKSTLAQAVAKQLLSNNMSAQFVEEHDVLEIAEFQGYVRQVQYGHGDDSKILISCCTKYIQKLELNLPEISVIDSLLPCWDWLASENCSAKKISQFTNLLCTQLKGLNPILIIVEGDIELALSRAVADRGKLWALDKAEQRTDIREVSAYLGYLLKLRRAMEQNLASWPYKMVRVNTTNQNIQQSLLDIMNVLDA